MRRSAGRKRAPQIRRRRRLRCNTRPARRPAQPVDAAAAAARRIRPAGRRLAGSGTSRPVACPRTSPRRDGARRRHEGAAVASLVTSLRHTPHHVPPSLPLFHVSPSHTVITSFRYVPSSLPPSRPSVTSSHHVPVSRSAVTSLVTAATARCHAAAPAAPAPRHGDAREPARRRAARRALSGLHKPQRACRNL